MLGPPNGVAEFRDDVTIPSRRLLARKQNSAASSLAKFIDSKDQPPKSKILPGHQLESLDL